VILSIFCEQAPLVMSDYFKALICCAKSHMPLTTAVRYLWVSFPSTVQINIPPFGPSAVPAHSNPP
jgi:hypothetical protein